MRIHESCVSSEDIKYDCQADKLMGDQQQGFGIIIIKGDNWIGCIDYHAEYLGDDFLISKVKIYDDKKLSEELTKKYKGKILIASIYKDNCN